ncbi:ABC transporter permease [Thermoclostridium stercorarium subsp. thermolacticum DSM 2910]|nr:ABC transporter substrate-binding protein [Thermoclostridium stercorarium]ANW99491.1 ABC transporter permease [Thermoclostridium stercorarium subsp. thermolacticum DSM 2910]
MKKKIFSILLIVAVLTTLLAACGGKTTTGNSSSGTGQSTSDTGTSGKTESKKTVTITYFNTSAEVNEMFEKMFKRYNELNPDVVIELIPTGIGEGQQEKLQSLYASGNAPTFMNVDPANVIEYQDHLLEFTEENAPWLSYAEEDAIASGTFDGKILGAPWSVQGYGLLYNKRVVDEIFGEGNFDPKSINTRDALEAFFKKCEEAGVPATMLHGANWSLGGHYLTLVYAVQGRKTEDGVNFIEKIKSGEIDIADDPIFQGYMDTFDLLAKYNYNKADPLVADFNRDAQAFAEGKCATFFMGDWLWTTLVTMENIDTEYGFIPVPWSNDPNAYGNSEVVMVLPKFQCINKSQSTAEQQEAALKALGWMLTDPEGQQFFLDQGFYMPYKNVRKDITYNSMTTSIAEYAQRGKTINLGVFSYISGDVWTETGNLMLKYLAGAITREELAKGINEYWRSTNK